MLREFKGPFAETLTRSRRAFIYAMVFSACINVLMLTVPIYMMQVFDRVLASRSGETLIFLTLIALVCVAGMGLLEISRQQILTRISSYVDRSLGPETFRHVMQAALSGDPYQAEAGRDLQQVRGFLSGPAVVGFFDVPWIPIYLIVLFLVHPVMGVLGVLGAIMMVILAIATEMRTRDAIGKATGEAVQATRVLDVASRAADVVDCMGLGRGLVGRYAKHTDLSIQANEIASDRSASMGAMVRFARLVLQILTLGGGAWLVVLQQMTPGATIAASIIMTRALAPIDQIVAGWKQIVTARSAAVRLMRFLEQPLERLDAMPLPAPRGQINVENLTYVPPKREKAVLRDVNFSIAPGQVCAVVGPSGAGKSTLARLLVGVMKPTRGVVRLDNADVWLWPRDQFGEFVGYLPQDIRLFGASVSENIARLSQGDPEAVVAAAKAAGVHDLILRLPRGYETDIGEHGQMLSAGQRQRLALARAVYGWPRFLVLDEPNSNLDGDGEAALFALVEELKARGTAVAVITHRPNLLKAADTVLVLNDGQVAAFGPRDEVLAGLNNQARKTTAKGDRPAAVAARTMAQGAVT
jgi:PrtD family type I secretion system ABC transporter